MNSVEDEEIIGFDDEDDDLITEGADFDSPEKRRINFMKK